MYRLENVRGTDALVIHSLYGDEEQSVNDKLIRLLFFLGALRDAGADSLRKAQPGDEYKVSLSPALWNLVQNAV